MSDRIFGIMFSHENDFGYWEGFNLTKEEENIIQDILMRHDTEGWSICGSLSDIAKEIGGFL